MQNVHDILWHKRTHTHPKEHIVRRIHVQHTQCIYEIVLIHREQIQAHSAHIRIRSVIQIMIIKEHAMHKSKNHIDSHTLRIHTKPTATITTNSNKYTQFHKHTRSYVFPTNSNIHWGQKWFTIDTQNETRTELNVLVSRQILVSFFFFNVGYFFLFCCCYFRFVLFEWPHSYICWALESKRSLL